MYGSLLAWVVAWVVAGVVSGSLDEVEKVEGACVGVELVGEDEEVVEVVSSGVVLGDGVDGVVAGVLCSVVGWASVEVLGGVTVGVLSVEVACVGVVWVGVVDSVGVGSVGVVLGVLSLGSTSEKLGGRT